MLAMGRLRCWCYGNGFIKLQCKGKPKRATKRECGLVLHQLKEFCLHVSQSHLQIVNVTRDAETELYSHRIIKLSIIALVWHLVSAQRLPACWALPHKKRSLFSRRSRFLQHFCAQCTCFVSECPFLLTVSAWGSNPPRLANQKITCFRNFAAQQSATRLRCHDVLTALLQA